LYDERRNFSSDFLAGLSETFFLPFHCHAGNQTDAYNKASIETAAAKKRSQ